MGTRAGPCTRKHPDPLPSKWTPVWPYPGPCLPVRHAITLTDADTAFVRSLTADEVYVHRTPSLVDLDMESARLAGPIVLPLYDDAVAQPDDAYRSRLAYVVFAAIVRPVGANLKESTAHSHGFWKLSGASSDTLTAAPRRGA